MQRGCSVVTLTALGLNTNSFAVRAPTPQASFTPTLHSAFPEEIRRGRFGVGCFQPRPWRRAHSPRTLHYPVVPPTLAAAAAIMRCAKCHTNEGTIHFT